MEVQQIDVYIDQNGNVQIEVAGVKGQKCLDLTKSLETALGGAVEERTMKPEAELQDNVFNDEQQWQREP